MSGVNSSNGTNMGLSNLVIVKNATQPEVHEVVFTNFNLDPEARFDKSVNVDSNTSETGITDINKNVTNIASIVSAALRESNKNEGNK